MAADIQAQASAPRVVEGVEKSAPAMVVPGRTNKPSTVAQPITEDPQKLYIREQIQMLGKSNPATVAQLIQTWMDEDRRN
jgi:flagellar biosynthesis/type III secretory pathway M-ring protein FliF/YscJ